MGTAKRSNKTRNYDIYEEQKRGKVEQQILNRRGKRRKLKKKKKGLTRACHLVPTHNNSYQGETGMIPRKTDAHDRHRQNQQSHKSNVIYFFLKWGIFITLASIMHLKLSSWKPG